MVCEVRRHFEQEGNGRRWVKIVGPPGTSLDGDSPLLCRQLRSFLPQIKRLITRLKRLINAKT